MTKPLQTTIAGSLPKPNWLAKPGELYGEIEMIDGRC
jgi:hypothetical protein